MGKGGSKRPKPWSILEFPWPAMDYREFLSWVKVENCIGRRLHYPAPEPLDTPTALRHKWKEINWNFYFCGLTHCSDRNVDGDKRWTMRSSNLRAPGPGRRTLDSPLTEQGSIWGSVPIHQPPGVTFPVGLWRRVSSILSSTGSSLSNFLANAAPLAVMFWRSSTVRDSGCCFGGVSQAM